MTFYTAANQVFPTRVGVNRHQSPLYLEQLRGIREALEKVRPGAVTLSEFDSLAQFSGVMAELMQTTTPYTLSYREA